MSDIPANLFRIIHSMYEDICCRIKFLNGISDEFPSTRGVKQGDVLSPLLFNLFINDLVKSLDSSECDPIVIGDLTINSLFHADDILLSNSKEGLQKTLNCLNEFCDNWKLNVNHEKLKVMVFNSNRKAYINHFKFHDKVLETVKSFCYLGITIKYTGNISASATLLMVEGRKSFLQN